MGSAGDQGDQGLDAHGLSVVVLAARYNSDIVERMIEGAQAAWLRHGGEAGALRVARVPGAFELPLAALQLARRGADAVVVLGCVIRGETAHFEYVSSACAHGVQQAMLDSGVPIAFGVLTTDTVAQAEERAAPQRGDKGGEALETALAMVQLLRMA